MATGMLVMSYSAPATLTAKAAHDHHCYGRSRKVGTNIIVSMPENGGVVLSGNTQRRVRQLWRGSIHGPLRVRGLAGITFCLDSFVRKTTVAGPFQPAECSAGRLIIPIFFGVEPSHVRHQAGPFQPAFKSYHNDKKVDKAEVDKWRDAFKTVANISGYSLKDDATWHEAMLVEKVVHHLQRHLDSDHLFVADNPVGMDSRTKDMMKLLQIERNGVKIVGLVGTGGIGKTTIAKAVFNELCPKFGSTTFLSNIRESWKHALSKMQLMKQLMEEIMDDRVTQIHNLDAGQRLFRDRIPPKKVLIVLDDVDHLNQLVLIGDMLFRAVINNKTCTKQDMYEDIQWKVVAVTGGLPLALRVFGSYLSDKSDRDEWKDYLDKLQQTPDQDIQKCLQISYDGLYGVEKEIFLDIACIFIGHDQRRNDVIEGISLGRTGEECLSAGAFGQMTSLRALWLNKVNLEVDKIEVPNISPFLNLEKLPDAICQLTLLQTLHIKQFPRLESLPERLGNLKLLNTLELEELAITSIPSSIGQLIKLREMYLRKLDRLPSLPDSVSSLNSLQLFNVEGTDLKGIKIDGVDLMDIE
ncbi:disease resistance protein RPV1-like [Nymphaea colorata]|nr:disease resistance protein RPV1-like [Nymphaea colorata]